MSKIPEKSGQKQIAKNDSRNNHCVHVSLMHFIQWPNPPISAITSKNFTFKELLDKLFKMKKGCNRVALR